MGRFITELFKYLFPLQKENSHLCTTCRNHLGFGENHLKTLSLPSWHMKHKSVISHKRTFLNLCMGQHKKKVIFKLTFFTPKFHKGTMDQKWWCLLFKKNTLRLLTCNVLNTAVLPVLQHLCNYVHTEAQMAPMDLRLSMQHLFHLTHTWPADITLK